MGGLEGSELRVCGPLEVVIEGESVGAQLPGRQGRMLLAYLIENRARAVPRTELLEVLWGEGRPDSADGALSALLSKLRKALGPERLVGRSDVRLVLPEPVVVDAEQAESAGMAADAALAEGDYATAVERAREAAAVDVTAYLPDCESPWISARQEALQAVRLHALEVLATAAIRLSPPELAVAEQAARAAITAAPYRESAYRALMEVHEAAGNHAEALRVFDDLRTRLRIDLGTSPGPETMDVFERLLRGETVSPGGPRETERSTWPSALAAAAGRGVLVGREPHVAALETHWREAMAGQRRLVVLTGEAGIGKTRLTAELARQVHDEGAVVLYGRFDEETVVPYKPLLEMVRGWAAGGGLAALHDRVGERAASELALLLPELGAREPSDQISQMPGEGDAARLRLFDAVARLLAAMAANAPLLVVVDDLHWADRATLQLLRHLVSSSQPRRTLFVAAMQDAGLAREHPVHELLDDLRRAGALERREVTGLDEAEVRELVLALGGGDAGLVATLHGQTQGNPFFVEEVVRHLLETGDSAGIPEGVRDIAARRLARLDDRARAALGTAAVIGTEFDFDILERVGPATGDELMGALEDAVSARLLREIDVGTWAFRHELLRQALAEGLSALRRARLHAAVGEAILELRADDLDGCLPLLARHFAEAAALGEADRAVEFALAAARRADRLLAWEEAAEHYRGALQVLGETEDRLRCDLLLALGTSLQRAGLDSARQAFAEAVGIARGLGDPELLGRASLGFAGPWSTLARVDDDVVDLLEEALAEVGPEDSPLRARILARLSLELYYCGFPERRLELAEEAVIIGRRLGEPRTLAAALDALHYALWRPETVHERLEVAGELRKLAEATGDLELELEGAGWTVVDLLELGDVRGADIQVTAASRLADSLQLLLHQWWTKVMQATLAQLRGELTEAERLASEALQTGERGLAEQAVHYYAMNMFQTRREQGRLAEAIEPVRRFAAMYPAIPAWQGVLALSHWELGEVAEAREVFESVAELGWEALPVDANWLIATTVLAEVCAHLADAARARELYALLEPYARRNVVVGRAASSNGSVARPLGMLAACFGDHEAADRHFSDALAQHQTMGARPWSVRTRVAWAEALLARGTATDLERARDLLADAIVAADALGLVAVAERARALVPAGPGGPGGEAVSVSA